MKKIIIHKNLCKKCGICSTFCPKSVFDKDEDGFPLPIRLEQCIGCKLCSLRCPDFAVSLED